MNQNMCNMSELTRAEIGKLLGVDASTISRHKAKVMPQTPDTKTYNGPECISWAIAQVEKAATKDAGETDESRKWLTQFRKERAKMAKIERLEKEKELIPKEDITPEWTWRAGVYRNGLLAMSRRLPPLLEGKRQVEMIGPIKREACLLLASLFADSKYCPRSEIPKEYLQITEKEISK